MGMTQKIKIMMIKEGLNQKELADRLHCSQANLSKKFRLNDWRESDLQEIAEICGYRYEGFFVREDDRI